MVLALIRPADSKPTPMPIQCLSNRVPLLRPGFHANLFSQLFTGKPAAMNKSHVFVLAFTLFICGCSTIHLFYRNADWYLQYKINSYTSFNAPQKELIRQDVSDYMHWHRKYALPEYIIFLQNLNGAVQYQGQLEAEDVALMSSIVSSSGIGVKAAGGIRTYEDVQKMILAGATRIGASAGIKIVQEAKEVTLTK